MLVSLSKAAIHSLFVLLTLAGCASYESAPPSPAPPSTPSLSALGAASVASAPPVLPASAPAAPPPPAPLVAVPFNDAIAKSSRKLFADAAAQIGTNARTLIVDPLIDASSGQQTTSTERMGEMLTEVVRTVHPYWKVQTFDRRSLAAAPLLVIGTLTAIHTRNPSDEAADAFRICLRLIDLKTGRVVAKGLSRATVDSVDATPLPMFRDSPTWHKDATVNGYIKSCQGTPNIGDPIDPAYLLRLPAAAVLHEAQTAYADHRTGDAFRLFKEASAVADPDDLRVLNGLYLTSWKLGKKRDAVEVFQRIVARGFASRQLPLKLLFATGSTQPISVPDLQSQYALWLREIGRTAAADSACLRVIGHTSKTGSPAANDDLSARRAAYVKGRLLSAGPALRERVSSQGMGSRETLIGLGTDDLRDALDRRVEFRVGECGSAA